MIYIIAYYHQIQKELGWFARALPGWFHTIIIMSSPVNGKDTVICNIHSHICIAEKYICRKNHNIGSYYAVMWNAYLNIHSSQIHMQLFSFSSNFNSSKVITHKIYGKNSCVCNLTLFSLLSLKYKGKLFSSRLHLYGIGRVRSAICWAQWEMLVWSMLKWIKLLPFIPGLF